MVTVKLTYGEEKGTSYKGLFLEGAKNRIYKDASIDNRIFIYLYKDGTICRYKTRNIKLYQRGCESIKYTQNDKIHLLLNNYIIECEILYYRWYDKEIYVDAEARYEANAEYKITNIYLCDEEAVKNIRVYIDKCKLGNFLESHLGMKEEKVEKILSTCEKVDRIEKDKFICFI